MVSHELGLAFRQILASNGFYELCLSLELWLDISFHEVLSNDVLLYLGDVGPFWLPYICMTPSITRVYLRLNHHNIKPLNWLQKYRKWVNVISGESASGAPNFSMVFNSRSYRYATKFLFSQYTH